MTGSLATEALYPVSAEAANGHPRPAVSPLCLRRLLRYHRTSLFAADRELIAFTMAQRISQLYSLVTIPKFYSGLQHLLGGPAGRQRLFNELIRPRPGMKVLDVACGPGLVALALSDDWDRFGPAITDWRRTAVYYAAITSEGQGRVRAIPGWRDPLVTYRLTRRDRALLGRGLARLALVLLEAGALDVYASFRGAPLVRARRDLAALQGTFAVGRASVMTVHLCSTVPMGGDDRRSGADSWGRVHGSTNVHVNDASLLPDAPGVNPQASVMALAIRNARHFLDTRTGGSGPS